jgi:hypothetical protein
MKQRFPVLGRSVAGRVGAPAFGVMLPALEVKAGRQSRGWVAVAGTLMLAGCLSRPNLVQQSFSFMAPSLSSDAQPGFEQVLAVQKVVVAPPFDTQALTYRTGEYSFERDPYAQFLVPPGESLSAALKPYLSGPSGFKAVVEPGGLLHVDAESEVHVEELYGDFRTPQEPKAVLAIRFLFRGSVQEFSHKGLFDKEYREAIPLQARTAQAVMAGWNEALGRIVAAVLADLKAQAAGSTIMHNNNRPPARRSEQTLKGGSR